MPRNAPTPLGADIMRIEKGSARPLDERGRMAAPAENRVGITVRFPASVHERLRVLAFERRTSKQALIEQWVADQLTTVQR